MMILKASGLLLAEIKMGPSLAVSSNLKSSLGEDDRAISYNNISSGTANRLGRSPLTSKGARYAVFDAPSISVLVIRRRNWG